MAEMKSLDASTSTFSGRNVGSKKRKRIKQKAAVKAFTHDEFMAAAIGDTAWLKQSLKGEKDASRFDRNGLAAIHLAALHGRLDCLKFLVESCNVDVNLASSTGWRALHLSINSRTGKRGIQCLQYLLDKGADPSVYNVDMLTPSHQAAIEGSAKCLESLIAAGANINLADSKGHIPLDYAKIWGHRICARLLASEGWKKDKEIQAQQMMKADILDKLKEKETRLKNEAREAERELYGSISFSNWLDEKGLPSKLTGPDTVSASQKIERCHSRSPNTKTGRLQKANSKTKPSITAESLVMRFPQMESNRTISPAVEAKNKTTKETSKPTERKTEKLQKVMQHQPVIKVTTTPAGRKSVRSDESDDFSELPQYMIDRLWLERMSKHDRPLTFKCQNIIDAQHKKLYDESQRPITETYAHLSDCVDSKLFPHPKSALKSAEGDPQRTDYDKSRMTNAMKGWSKPGRFPAIQGKEYKYAFEALKPH